MQTLAMANRELRQEITRRETVEKALKQSKEHYGVLLEQSNQMQEQLRLLSRQLLSAQEEERKTISRELHDVIAQTLTSINVRLANLKTEATKDSKGLDRSIARTQRLVEQSVDIVHRFARELRPTVLDDLGLIPALHTFLKGFREQTGIRASLSAFAEVEQINGDKRTTLFRVAQEALTNVARHARASRVEVKIEKLAGEIAMKIKDNGQGFREGRAKTGNRLGLLGMKERLEMVGGKFAVTSSPGKGTIVLVQIPLMNRLRGGEKKMGL
jgi:signal transduction histidine kinase